MAEESRILGRRALLRNAGAIQRAGVRAGERLPEISAAGTIRRNAQRGCRFGRSFNPTERGRARENYRYTSSIAEFAKSFAPRLG